MQRRRHHLTVNDWARITRSVWEIQDVEYLKKAMGDAWSDYGWIG